MTKLLPPKQLKLDPKLVAFSYQKEAAESIRDKEYAAIFHEQGLGKTKMAVDIALYWLNKEIVDSVLIVTKKILVPNWMREFKTHTFLKPVVLTSSHKNNYYIFNGAGRIILANFEVVISEFNRFKLFLKCRDVGIIIDESAKIKTATAGVTKIFHELAPFFKRRIIMTGTPAANRPYDYWAQIWFLDQGKALGNDFKKFKSRVDLPKGPSEKEKQEFETALDEIWPAISGFSVRETKDSGVISLPRKVIKTIEVDWEPRQHDMYCSYRDNLRAIIIKEGVPQEDKAESILKRLLRLVQISSNPKLVDQSYAGDPGKLSEVRNLVEKITREKQKCIIWSSFNENIDWLAIELKPFGTCKVHGKMKMDDRNRSIERFLGQPETRVLIATPGAAKEGLTLTVANHAIFYDRSFSLDDYLQAQDRIHRISQKKTCFIYNLIMSDSIDQWVDILIQSKYTSAKLAQGDITKEEFTTQMDYSFHDMLRSVLNLPKS